MNKPGSRMFFEATSSAGIGVLRMHIGHLECGYVSVHVVRHDDEETSEFRSTTLDSLSDLQRLVNKTVAEFVGLLDQGCTVRKHVAVRNGITRPVSEWTERVWLPTMDLT